MTNKIYNDTKHDIDADVPMWCRMVAVVAPALALGTALGIALFMWVMA